MRRTPQEKKRLSYAKDRRNVYGENDKSSRKNIPRGRQRAHRANRRGADQALRAALGPADEAVADRAEQVVRTRRPAVFRKAPDAPLGEVVAGRLRRRVRLGMDQAERSEARVERVHRHWPTP
ncbi:hypothetical protein ALI22I_34385 [Saccharothrix sp. ALI-22-I]|uniref:hypothetical protein n=1 Tax=Saccharothrix sp. ALI-22-I TaxID=1933778 RepID=UPI00097C32F1|nr:hypothetical protein [Saccharothrix sp. ALI-22-I]ONI83571.1 hypothetical protein ALI22I_34385 [Saccharothrix sp. ALI-22-I]